MVVCMYIVTLVSYEIEKWQNLIKFASPIPLPPNQNPLISANILVAQTSNFL